jgi:hypothetical protein
MENSTINNDQPIVDVILPAKHIEIQLTRANETYLFGSRGSLKTFRGIALYCVDCIYDMPRSTGIAVALSYEHFDKNTLAPLLGGFENLGYIQGKHFVVNKKPPEDWPKPLLGAGTDDYDRTITWHNGTVIKLISLARKAGSNAISAQWGFFDEAKFMDPDDLNEIFPIFRGNEQFSLSSRYLSKFFATDKLADPAEIEWLLKKRDLVDHIKVQDVQAVQCHVNILKARMFSDQSTLKEKKQLKRQIYEYEMLLNKERSDMVYVAEINCYDVLPILGEAWLKAAKRICRNEYTWSVAYENADPDRPAEVFYPGWDENKLCYDTHGDEDILLSEAFIISLDYQHTVAPLPVAQISTLPGADRPSLNYVDYIYSLYPEGLRDAVKKFCKKYKNHSTKIVHYAYDHTAIGKRTDADEYCVIVIDELQLNGWEVMDAYTGQAAGHYQRYLDTKDWMEQKDPEELAIRIHRTRCAKMIKAISGAPAKTSAGKTEKDKKYENSSKYPDLDQSTTTHVTDAFDMINDAVLKQKLIKASEERSSIGFR